MRTLALFFAVSSFVTAGCGTLHGRRSVFNLGRSEPARPIPASGDSVADGANQAGQTTNAAAITSESELNAATRRAGTATAPNNAADNNGSPLSIGSLIGVSFPLYKPENWFVRDRVVQRQRSVETEDYFMPGVYLLPSLTLIGTAGHSLSVIVPFGLDSRRNASAGIGVSWGFGVRRGTEVGVALAAIWTPAPRLSEEQQRSLDTATVLPAGASDLIEMSPRLSLGFGIYITPQF